MVPHYVDTFNQDDLGFTIVRCNCGVDLGPFPDDETAIDALMSHAWAAGYTDGVGTS